MDIPALVRETLDMFRPLLPGTIELRFTATAAPPVAGDADKLAQVFMNLFTNASQALSNGPGVLDIRVDVPGPGEVPPMASEPGEEPGEGPGRFLTLRPAPPRTWVRLRVTDTGCGISPEDLSRIFDPFFTTRPKTEGTGLGLAVVQGIVRLHGGLVSVDSAPGRGAAFTVLLPAMNGAPAGPPPPEALQGADAPRPESPRKTLPGGSESLLLVDDNPDITRPLARLLTRLGYTVTVAASGAEALELVEAGAPVALLLTDYDMPGMHGVALARCLRTLKGRVPVLLLTGVAREAIPESDADLRAAGISAVLGKPVEHAHLARALRAALEGTA